MATLYATIGLLRAEVEARIANLVPTGYPNKRFKARPKKDRRERDIIECTGRSRLFELGKADSMDDSAWCGHTTRPEELRFPLSIVYRDTETWNRSALDDMDRIAQDLRANYSAAPAGVEIRHIDRDTEMQIIRHDEDPWFVAVANIYALIRVS